MIRIEENFSLLPFNTFGLDVKARYFVEYDSVDALCDLLAQDWLQGKALLNVGEGSNLLFLDHFDGVVLHSAIGGIEPLRTNSEHQIGRASCRERVYVLV